MKRKEFPEQALLDPLCGQEVLIRFDGLEFSTQLVEVEMQKLTALVNAPSKRKNSEGKSYTPKCLRLICAAGALVIVLEDCRLVAIHKGIAFMFDTYTLEVRRVD
jgi:hypothetical protein